jgi:hypothetical protein
VSRHPNSIEFHDRGIVEGGNVVQSGKIGARCASTCINEGGRKVKGRHLGRVNGDGVEPPKLASPKINSRSGLFDARLASRCGRRRCRLRWRTFCRSIRIGPSANQVRGTPRICDAPAGHHSLRGVHPSFTHVLPTCLRSMMALSIPAPAGLRADSPPARHRSRWHRNAVGRSRIRSRTDQSVAPAPSLTPQVRPAPFRRRSTDPGFSWLNRANQRMLRFVEMLGGMLVFR